ncbi:MAG: 4-hydroxythreonine-4-phosphate dehydrogenase PdxA, partial [Sphingomonas sp.]
MLAPLAISMGDPAGIGPEIIAKAWAQRVAAGLPAFFATGDARAVAAVWDGPIEPISHPEDANRVFETALPVLTVEDGGEIVPGIPDVEGARCALRALELAAGLVRSGAARALVTGPVSKAQLYQIGFNHPGQTEFVAERCGIAGENAVMMLAGPDLRVVPITTHVPLAAVSDLLSVDLLVSKGRATARGLARNFGILNPRIAFAGFNPHAGESGAIGREEIDLIAPAIEILRADGI